MNILKEMGIQLWQRRSAETTVLVSDKQAANVTDGPVDENPSLRAALSSDSEVGLDEVFNQNTSSHQSISATPSFEEGFDSSSEFSGSLRQALNQSKPESNNAKLKVEVAEDQAKESVVQETQVAKSNGVSPINLSSLLEPKTEQSVDQAVAELNQLDVENVDTYTNVESDDLGVVSQSLSTADWPRLQSMIETNEHCPSCGWGNGHLGAGDQQANWLFITDAPNVAEVQAQALFSGRAGQLFESMLNALGLNRENIYCTSIFKCAPTDDLSIVPQCNALVHRQIELISPKVVIVFGEFAAQSVIKSDASLPLLRTNKQYCFQSKVPVIPTHSPAEMLDDVSLKAEVWADLKQAINLSHS